MKPIYVVNFHEIVKYLINHNKIISVEWRWTSSWTQCTATCGGGVMNRTRECYNSSGVLPPEACEKLDGQGMATIPTMACGMRPCTELSSWTEWALCPALCAGAETTRTRSCIDLRTNEEVPGFQCDPSKQTTDTTECNTHPCPGPQWAPWQVN